MRQWSPAQSRAGPADHRQRCGCLASPKPLLSTLGPSMGGGLVAGKHLQGSPWLIQEHMQQAGRSLNGERFCSWYGLQDLNRNE